MDWIRTHLDRILIGGAAGCIAVAMAVLGYATFADAPGVAFIVTLFTGALFFAAWTVWYLMRRAARSRRNASQPDRAR